MLGRCTLILLIAIPAAVYTAPTVTVPVTVTRRAAATGDWLSFKPGDSLLCSLEQDIPESATSDTGLAVDANTYDVDLFNTSPETIAEYKKRGKKVVCYFSAGTWEDKRPDSGDFTPECYRNKGSKCKMQRWPEYWFDLNSPSCLDNVKGIMAKRIALAHTNGCDAVEPDNTDSYTNEPGWATTIDDQFEYLEFLTQTAHDAGLAIALKNGADMIAKKPAIVDITDFVLIEECAVNDECGSYSAFIKAGKAAFQVEYETSTTATRFLKASMLWHTALLPWTIATSLGAARTSSTALEMVTSAHQVLLSPSIPSPEAGFGIVSLWDPGNVIISM